MTRKRPLKKLTRRWRPALAVSFIRATGRLPLPLARRLATGLARFSYAVGGRAVEVSRDNLQRCFPELPATEREALVKESLIQTAITAAEAAAIWSKPYEAWQPYLAGIDGRERLEAQQKTGRGLLLLAPHLGNWEALAPILPRHVRRVGYMYQPTGMPALDDVVVAGRGKYGGRLFPTTRQGVSQVLRALKAGEAVGILPDQVPDEGGGQPAPFFGHPALTMTLVYKLIQRTDCDVLMVFAKREGSRFRVVLREPDPAIRDADLATSLAALNRSVEACVREAPEQYQWEYKRFKGVSAD